MAHRIRLRHPWVEARQKLDAGAEPPETSQYAASSSCLPQPAAAHGDPRVVTHKSTFSRRFNSPTGLSDDDRIEIELLNQVGEILTIELNEQALDFTQAPSTTSNDSPADLPRLPIGQYLQAHNELQITLRRAGSFPELGEVNLWLHSSDDASQ